MHIRELNHTLSAILPKMVNVFVRDENTTVGSIE